MCNTTVAVMALSAGLQYKVAQGQAKNTYAQQKRQNELAKKNAIQRYAAEQLKIRQVAKRFQEKGYEATLKGRKKRAEFITQSGSRGLALSGSTNRLLGDYYRIEGRYKASLDRNMDINLSQHDRTMEAIQFGQESQSTYLTPPNSNLLFASSALNFANNYYTLEALKESKDIK
ncbi:MAG: hypothetical protein H8D84_00635 [Proteobacteria bacterium]|nr:hypothetical protein [Pseudomonadota bacterium]